MENIKIIDNYMDDREFRNYIATVLPKFGFDSIKIEDTRISDDNKENDNDIYASKNGFSYTVLTYLNKKVTKNELGECIKDIEHEGVTCGVIVSNMEVDSKIKEEAKRLKIEIIDRNLLKKLV